jgi:LysM repeat protein
VRTTTTSARRRFYTVVAGDTFGVIAAKTKTTVQQLELLNPGVSSTSLHIGQRLRVA